MVKMTCKYNKVIISSLITMLKCKNQKLMFGETCRYYKRFCICWRCHKDIDITMQDKSLVIPNFSYGKEIKTKQLKRN